MNINLNDYTPSKELSPEDRHHYVNARYYFNKFGEDNNALKKDFREKMAKIVPQKVQETKEFKIKTEKFEKIVDLAYEDHVANQENPNNWKRYKA